MEKQNGIYDIQVKSSTIRIRVSDENGKEMGIVSFNPNDHNLITRVQNGYRKIREVIQTAEEELNRIGWTEDTDILSNEEYFARLTKADRELKEILDYMFDSPFSEIFGNMSVMTPTADGYLLFSILESILPVVEKEASKIYAGAEKHYAEFKERH